MPRYKKCPRCELNYILEEEDYCEVCKAELKGIDTNIDDEEEIICPKCKQNYVEPGEKYCLACLQKMQGNWDDSKSDIEEDDELTSLSEMEEQEWADDDIDSFDDNDSFGNEADFIDRDEDFDGKETEEEFDEEGEEDYIEDELEKDFEEVEQLGDLDDFDEEDEEEDEFDVDNDLL